MPELGTYVKIGCDTEGCAVIAYANARVYTEPTAGYCGEEAVVEIDELPRGWGMDLTNNYKTELYYCPVCCDKIEKETGIRPWRC